MGDFVNEGQTLAILENPMLHHEVAKLKAEVKSRRFIYDRLRDIQEKTPQLTTVAEVERAEAEFESMNAQLNSVLLQLEYLEVKAPFSGVIFKRYVDKGALVQGGVNNTNALPLFELQDLVLLRLTLDVPEADAILTNPGTEAVINFPELPGSRYTATVSRIAFGLNEATRTMRVEIDLPNTDLKIRSGMYASVELRRVGHQNALSVPNEALGNLKGQSFLYRVDDGIVRKVHVKTGLRDEKFTELVGGEVSLTDQIVVRGKEHCTEGAPVQTKNINTN
jgi:RND family efflux transporter MFP subunit